MEAALENIRQKTINSNRLAAYFCLAAAFVLAGVGIYEITRAVSTGRWVLAVYIPAFAVVFFVCGAAMLRMLKGKTLNRA
jgi:hypothetical protein